MEWYWIFLIFYGIGTAILDTMILVSDEPISKLLDDVLNPIIIYRTRSVGIFNCLVLSILGHLIAPWLVPFYWLCKLCTIGRK